MIEFTEEMLNKRRLQFGCFHQWQQKEASISKLKDEFASVAGDLSRFYEIDLARYWAKRTGYTVAYGNGVIGARCINHDDWTIKVKPENKSYEDLECESIWGHVLYERRFCQSLMKEKSKRYRKHLRYELRRPYIEPVFPVMNEQEVTQLFQAVLKYRLNDPDIDPIADFTDAIKLGLMLNFTVSVVSEVTYCRYNNRRTLKDWLHCPYENNNIQVCIEHFKDENDAYGHGALIGAMFMLDFFDRRLLDRMRQTIIERGW